jgi:hypothetical protein
MRISLLPIVALVALAFASPALASQDLRSPDARDAAAAGHAQTLQDLARLRAGGTTSKDDPALAQERYYSSYGKAAPVHHGRDDNTPWDAIAAGIVLIGVVAAAVGIAVRTRRRVSIAA